MGSELGIIVTAIIFVGLVLVLSSTFFIPSSENDELGIIDYDGEVITPKLPFNTSFKSVETNDDDEITGISWLHVVAGGLLATAGVILIPVTAGFSLGLSVFGGAMIFDQATGGTVSSFVDAVAKGINWLMTAMWNFGNLIAIELPVIGDFPVILFAVMMPVIFVFLYFIIKIVRGI